jgi:hypothetical protein
LPLISADKVDDLSATGCKKSSSSVHLPPNCNVNWDSALVRSALIFIEPFNSILFYDLRTGSAVQKTHQVFWKLAGLAQLRKLYGIYQRYV